MLEELNYELERKYKQAEENEVLCEQYEVDGAEIAVVAYGVAARMVRSAVAKARELGVKVGWIRPITLWPFPYEQICAAAEEFRIFLTVEMSLGQMVEDVKLAVAGKCPVIFYGRAGGGVPTVEQVLERIKQLWMNKDKQK